jgi:hypothetical protein
VVKRQLIFIIISFLFLFPYNISFDIVKDVIPVTLPSTEKIKVYNLLTFIWFISVAYLYRLITKRCIIVSKAFFIIHVFFSVLPLLSLGIPLVQLSFGKSQSNTLTLETIRHFRNLDNIYYYLGVCFLLGQLTFTAILLFRLISNSGPTKRITQQQL